MRTNQSPVEQSGTMQGTGDRKEMGITQAGKAAIMAILSGMYSDQYAAVLREYAVNGYDSHLDSGQDRPIEVTLPSALQPTLIIQDFGTGLSRDGIMDIYSDYGVSTKSETREVGGFGIGSKSAFTMGQQFFVTGVKDGQKTVALFALNEHNIPEVEVMFEGATEEANGVQVSLAVEDVERMRETAAKVFAVWPKGSVLVDGQEPDCIFDAAFKVNESIVLVNDEDQELFDGGVYATMGPVAYPVSSQMLRQVVKVLDGLDSQTTAASLVDWSATTAVFFRAEVNDFDIAPTREALQDSRNTINRLAAYVTGLHQDLVESVQKRLDTCQTRYQAALVLHEAQEEIRPLRVSRKSVSFQGVDGFKRDVDIALPTYILGTKNYRSTTKIVQHHKDHTIDANTADKVLVVTEVPKGEESTVYRYAKRFLEDNERGIETIIVTPASSASYQWFQFGIEGGAKTLTRDEYRATLREMRQTSPRLRNEPSYTTGWGQSASRELEDRDLLTDILSWGKDILLFNDSAPSGDEIVRAVLDDYTPVVLLGTQSEKALRKRIEDDGTVKVVDVNWRDLIRQHAETLLAQVTDAERAALGAVRWLDENKHTYAHTDVRDWNNWETALGGPEVVKHPVFAEVREAAELAELVAQDIGQDRRKELVVVTKWAQKSLDAQGFDYEIPSLGETLPLLEQIGTYSLQRSSQMREDALDYVNRKRFQH